MTGADQIPAPRTPDGPRLAEQATADELVQSMITHVAGQAAAVNFLALPATVRCEILISISDLSAVMAAAAVMHPARIRCSFVTWVEQDGSLSSLIPDEGQTVVRCALQDGHPAGDSTDEPNAGHMCAAPNGKVVTW